MKLVRSAMAGLALALPATVAPAQTFPVTGGTLEFQLGVAGVVLPEDINGTYSAQPELRAGIFVLEGLQLQGEFNVRVWPLGDEAPRSYGGAAQVLWFPKLGSTRNIYALGGVGASYLDYPTSYGLNSEVAPSLRVAAGMKISMAESLASFMRGGHLNIEFRGEWLRLSEEAAISGRQLDFASGIAIGYSIFR